MTQKRKIEDYMKRIYQLEQEGIVRGAYIARKLGVSKPTVSVALKELEEQEYLVILSNRTVQLTEKGRQIAENVINRNRIIYSLLIDLGVDSATAETDACNIEHIISDESINAFETLADYLNFIRQTPLK